MCEEKTCSIKKELPFWGIVCAAALFLYLFQIAEIPFGYHADEYGMAYDAFCMANHGGVDRYLTVHPVYLSNYGNGQSVLYASCSALLMKLIGANIWAIRLPAVLSGILGLFSIAFLIRERFGVWASRFAAILYLALPYFILRSRWGFDCNLWMPLMACGLALLQHAAITEKTSAYWLSSAVFALSLYAYAPNYFVLPIFLLLAFLYLLWCKRITWKQLLGCGVVLGVLALPLLAFVAVNQFDLPELVTPLFTINKIPNFRSGEFQLQGLKEHFIKALKAIFLHDEYEFNAISRFGVMYRISVPFLLLGFVLLCKRFATALRQRHYSTDVLVLVLLLPILLYASMVEPNIGRINAVYLCSFYALFSALHWCATCLGGRLPALHPKLAGKQAVLAALLLAYAICFAQFAEFYYVRYPGIWQEYPETNFRPEATEALTAEAERIAAADHVYLDMYDTEYALCTQTSPYAFDFAACLQDGSFGNLFFTIPDASEWTDGDVFVIWKNDSFYWAALQESGRYQQAEYGQWLVFYAA